jgi:molybdopterin-binding protein
VSLARAFVLQPELLLLDEPFGALDTPTRLRLLDDLQSLLDRTGVTTIFITHDRDEALFLGDRVAVMLDGQIRQTGAPDQVLSAPTDSDVAAFVGVENVINGQVVQSYEGRVIIEAKGVQIEAIGDMAIGREVCICLRPEDVTIWTLDTSPASSARNRFNCQVLRIIPQGPLVRLFMDCGFQIVALITRASAQELEITEGQGVTASFKATAAHIIPR